MHLGELKAKPVEELLTIAEGMGIENLSRQKKQDVIFNILKTHSNGGEDIEGEGVLEILNDGFGFLRAPESNYLPGPDDIYVSPSQIRRFGLRNGDTVEGLFTDIKSERPTGSMYMFDYSLIEIVLLLQMHGFTNMHLETENMGGHISVHIITCKTNF